MHLHGIVGPIVATINPTILVTIKQSAGYTTNPDFSRTPAYNIYTNVPAQIQALQFNDLKMIENLGITGVRRKIYLYTNIYQGIVRGLQRGGDLVIFPDNTEWLLVFIFEAYGDGLVSQNGWMSVCVTLQNPTSEG